MNDVRPCATALYLLEHQIDRGILGLVRTRLQIGAIRRSARSPDELRKLRVNEKRRVGIAKSVECFTESGGVEAAELGHSRIDQKASESQGPFADHGAEVAGISRNRATPQPDIDPAFSFHRP